MTKEQVSRTMEQNALDSNDRPENMEAKQRSLNDLKNAVSIQAKVDQGKIQEAMQNQAMIMQTIERNEHQIA